MCLYGAAFKRVVHVFVLAAHICQERNYFLVTLKANISRAAFLLLLDLAWVVHGIKIITELP